MTTKKPLRVAMIAPPWLRVPPAGYGGIETVLASLIRGLQRLGVSVELFAVGGTDPGCPVHYCYGDEQYKFMHRVFEDSGVPAAGHVLFALNEIASDGNYDIIHDHNMSVGPLALRWATDLASMPPALHTNHWSFFTTEDTIAKGRPDYTPSWQAFSQASRTFMVGISDFQMSSAPKELQPRILPVVYNGIDIEQLLFKPTKQDYFLTLARFLPAKGLHVAAQLCAEAGYSLKMAGPVAELTEPSEVTEHVNNQESPYRNNEAFEYFRQKIWPILQHNKSIEYVGNLSGQAKQHTIANARALLFPIIWDEPFGLAVIEALASGTPVIAMRRGAMPEIIRHGENGFLADTEQEFRAYMERIDQIDPVVCRKTVEDYFSGDAMARAYLQRYQTILAADEG